MSEQPTPQTDALHLAHRDEHQNAAYTEMLDHAQLLEAECADLHVKDSVRTTEHNILVRENRAQAEEIKRLRADKARIDFLKEHTHFEFWVHHPDYDVHGGKRFNAEGIVFREVLDSAINWLSAAPVVAKEGK